MKIEITYLRGDKNLNTIMRKLDLYQEGEGVFISETMIGTVKKGRKFNKRQTINAICKAWNQLGFEVPRDQFVFKEIL